MRTLLLETLNLTHEQDAVRRSLVAWSAEEPATGELSTGRYTQIQLLGVGAMGRVDAVHDHKLERRIARKELLAAHDPEAALRFYTEAIVTARLDHPAIPPLHDFGRNAEGIPYFTMREVRGRSLQIVLAAIHATGRAALLACRPMVAALVRVAQAAGHAHGRGIIHRDIKPANILIGDEGEVYLVDWGVALVDPRRWEGTPVTGGGVIAGTFGYMPTEQRAGIDRVGPASDVYALGATLLEVLSGAPPHAADPCPARALQHLPEALVRLIRGALAEDPAQRPRDGLRFAAELSAWLDGERAREEAQALVVRAREAEREVLALNARSGVLRGQATRILAALPEWADTTEKQEAWRLEDEAIALEDQAERRDLEAEADLSAAQRRAPDLDEVNVVIAERLRSAHEGAIAAGDARRARRYEERLRRHDTIGAHTAWLSDSGELELHAAQVGATAQLYRIERQDRRLVPVAYGGRVAAPVRRTLPSGSWIARVSAPGYAESTLHLLLPRSGRWNGSPGGTGDTLPVQLVPLDQPGDACHVPAGDAIIGDPEARDAEPRRELWIPGFLCKRTPVTNAEYIVFLDDLVAQGRVAEAERHVPRDLAGDASGRGRPIFGRSGGGFVPIADATGDTWPLDWPVLCIDWASAVAWCDWRAGRTGAPWRLPWAIEREKAARGADGRPLPWGEAREPTWLRCRPGQQGRPTPAPVGGHATDCSVYGIMDVAGNSRDWCLDTHPGTSADGRAWERPDAPVEGDEGTWRIQKGGNWAAGVALAHAAGRFGVPAGSVLALAGVRPVRSWP